MKSKSSLVRNSAACLIGLGLLVQFSATQRAAAQGCDLFPIALSAQTLVGKSEGDAITDIFNGAQPGNFGWLSWTGAPDVPTLVASLTGEGNSSTYVNPDNPTDHVVSVGDWVQGSPGVANSSGVRDALDTLEDYEIIVPVWDQVRGTGSNAAYHVSGFARVHIVGYRLPSQNRISVTFLGYVSCDAPLPPV